MRRRLQKWIRKQLRAMIGVDAELTQLRSELEQLRRSTPQPEIRRKVHVV